MAGEVRRVLLEESLPEEISAAHDAGNHPFPRFRLLCTEGA